MVSGILDKATCVFDYEDTTVIAIPLYIRALGPMSRSLAAKLRLNYLILIDREQILEGLIGGIKVSLLSLRV